MTPAARVQAAIEILDQILTGVAAEKALTGWARRSRFAGSGDRAAIRDHVFDGLRRRDTLAARGGALSGRGVMLGALREAGLDPAQVFTGEGHAPGALSAEEAVEPELAGEIVDLPEWIYQRFINAFGDKAHAQAMELRQRAPVTVRVNLRKSTRDAACAALAQEGIASAPNPVADTALTVTEGARKLARSKPFLDGVIELQDASSQAAMAALELPPGGRVLDYCAGGGGKVLALAARADGQWFAHDADPRRMSDLPARAARAGVAITQIETQELDGMAPFDMILTDVPCSGSGTWRRAPMAKWVLTPDELSRLTSLQMQIAEAALERLRPGGQLVYSTCSVLREENEDIVAALTRQIPGLGVLSQTRWDITPQNDGFFCSVLMRA